MREFFGCYLLKSQHPLARGRTYIGFTVNPRRRIRQHNGHLTCGAKQTRTYRPWEMTLVLYGFPTQVQALQFEWAWQHPLKSKFVRATAMQLGNAKMTGLKGKILLLHEMLHLSPWKLYPLTLQFLAPEFAALAKGAKIPPRHIQVLVAPPEQLPDCLFDDDEAEIKRSREAAVTGSNAGGSSSDGSSSSSELDEDPNFCSQQESGSQLQSQPHAASTRTSSAEALQGPDMLRHLEKSFKLLKRSGASQGLSGEEPLSQLASTQAAVKGTSRARKPAVQPAATHTELSSDPDSKDVGGGSQRIPPASPTRGGRVKAARPGKLSCAVCESAAEQQVLQCVPCGSAFHLQCLADTWVLQQATSTAAAGAFSDSGMDQEMGSQLRPSCFGDVPENGNCPVCQEQLGWMNLLQNMKSQGWDQASRRKGRTKGKARGQASIDHQAADTEALPVKARRARAPPKTMFESKYVALVPATEEYIESLHLLFAPPPNTTTAAPVPAPKPARRKKKTSTAQAEPLVDAGLPPKKGRGRPGLARSLRQPSANPLPSQVSHHPGMDVSQPHQATLPPGQDSGNNSGPIIPHQDTSQHQQDQLFHYGSLLSAEQDHSEWEQDWECEDVSYLEEEICGRLTSAVSTLLPVPPTPIDLLSTSASEGPESPCTRLGASCFVCHTSDCHRDCCRVVPPFLQHRQQQQQLRSMPGPELSGSQGMTQPACTANMTEAQVESTAQLGSANAFTNGVPASHLRTLPFLERVRARVAAAKMSSAAAASSFVAAAHSIDLCEAPNMCDSPPAGPSCINLVTHRPSVQAHPVVHPCHSHFASRRPHSSSSKENSPRGTGQAATVEGLSSSMWCEGLRNDSPGENMASSGLQGRPIHSSKYSGGNLRGGCSCSTTAAVGEAASCQQHLSNVLHDSVVQHSQDSWQATLNDDDIHSIDLSVLQLSAHCCLPETTQPVCAHKHLTHGVQDLSPHHYSRQEEPEDLGDHNLEVTERASDVDTLEVTNASAMQSQLPSGLSCHRQQQQPAEFRKRGRSPKKAPPKPACEVTVEPESAAMCCSPCFDAISIPGSHLPLADRIAAKAQGIIDRPPPAWHQNAMSASNGAVVAEQHVYHGVLSYDSMFHSPISPSIAPSPFPLRRRHGDLAVPYLGIPQAARQDTDSDFMPERDVECIVIE